jgi:hypothetical protein
VSPEIGQKVANRFFPPDANELQAKLSTLRSAYSQGQQQFLTEMQNLGGTLFHSQEYLNRNRSDHDFVYDLYKAFLHREPDQGGLGLLDQPGADQWSR